MADLRDTIIAILIHVGADTSNLGYVGPHFNRAHTFRFLPMKEDYPTSNNPIYEALGLGDYVLSRDKRAPVHNDPQFNEEKGLFTYGENEIERSRLGKLKKGSIIFFVSSLAPYTREYYRQETTLTRMQTYQKGKKNKYVIGFFAVAGIRHAVVKLSGQVSFKEDAFKIGEVSERDAIGNQHFSEATGEKEFIVVKGDPKHSALLHVPIPLTKGQTKGTFRLSEIGLRLFEKDKKKTDNFRGVRDLDFLQTKALVQKIYRTNKKLRSRLPRLAASSG